MRFFWCVLAAVFGAVGCSSSQGAVVRVTVSSDYIAGAEVALADVELLDGTLRTDARVLDRAELALPFGTSLAAGVSVATFAHIKSGTYTLRGQLFRSDGTLVGGRPVVVSVVGDSAFTIDIMADCANVACPAVGANPAAIACLGGQCVDPRCSVDSPEYCVSAHFCGTDHDCATATSSCATAHCERGLCILEPTTNACAATEFCARDAGCAPLSPSATPPPSADPRCGTICAPRDPSAVCRYSYYACADGQDPVCRPFINRPLGAPCGVSLACDEANACAPVSENDAGTNLDAGNDAGLDAGMASDANGGGENDAWIDLSDATTDGSVDASDASDASDATVYAPCATNNGGCEQLCISGMSTYTCACVNGYTLNMNGTSCDDIDECAVNNGGCEHGCTNSVGSFSCTCLAGGVLDADGRTCHEQLAYLKASNNNLQPNMGFGQSVAMSADGTTIAIGSVMESSNATGINGDEANVDDGYAGAVYLFRKAPTGWVQEAYIKPSNTQPNMFFGQSVALSRDGNALVVGAVGEASSASGVNGDQTDTSFQQAGAAYVFRFNGAWAQEAYLKASNPRPDAPSFGASVSISADGETIAVGASGETTNVNGVNQDDTMPSAKRSGAAYIFHHSSGTWAQTAFIKASNTTLQGQISFGNQLALSADASTLVVAALSEASIAEGIDGDQTDTSSPGAGAAYVFRNGVGGWAQEAYVKPSNTTVSPMMEFGISVAISGDGNRFVVGGYGENGSSAGINGDETTSSVANSGAVYAFRFASGAWSQEAYIKPVNPQVSGFFGSGVAMSSDGNAIAVGAYDESSNATGIGGNPFDMSAAQAGAAYTFRYASGAWAPRSYIKASNTDNFGQYFGQVLAMSADAATLVVTAVAEWSHAVGINGDETDHSDSGAGAAYIFNDGR